MTHRCHAPGCEAQVPTNIFMCARHWRMVPKPLGKAISDVESILHRLIDGDSDLIKSDALMWRLMRYRDKIADGEPGEFPLAAALGTVMIGEPRKCTDIFKGAVDPDDIDPKMHGWPMIDPQPFPKPVPAMGAQGFWNWS